MGIYYVAPNSRHYPPENGAAAALKAVSSMNLKQSDALSVSETGSETMTLSQVSIGVQARIVSYKKVGDPHAEAYHAQLQRLGLIPGTIFKVIRRAPLGDPIEIRLRGYSLAIRPDEAQYMNLQILSQDNNALGSALGENSKTHNPKT